MKLLAILLLTITLSGCKIFAGVGTHPHADSWGSEYSQMVGIVNARQKLSEGLYLDYTHVSSVPDMDHPGLNTFTIVGEIK